MNYFQDEHTAAYNRQRIAEEFHQMQLERSALQSRVYQPGRFGRMMLNFANWMISTGKRLRKRYEIPDCTPAPSKRFAH